jgi:hypothetical protein
MALYCGCSALVEVSERLWILCLAALGRALPVWALSIRFVQHARRPCPRRSRLEGADGDDPLSWGFFCRARRVFGRARRQGSRDWGPEFGARPEAVVPRMGALRRLATACSVAG